MVLVRAGQPAVGPSTSDGSLRGMPRHSAMYALGTVLSKGVSLLMLPVYTRYLTPADYGVLQLLIMTVEVISIFAGSRIAVGIFHYYHKARDDAGKRAVLSTAIFLLVATYVSATVMAVLAAPWIADVVFGARGANVLYIQLAAGRLAFESLFLVPIAYLQLSRRSGLFVVVHLVALVLQIGFNVILLVPFGLGVLGVLIGSLAANAIVGGVLGVWLLRDVGLQVRVALLRPFLRFGVPLVGMQVATLVVTFGDRFFLNRAGGEAQVGLYGLAYQFGFILFALGYAPFERIWDPERFRIARRLDRDAIYARGWIYTNGVLLSITVLLALFGGDLIRLATSPAFHSAAPLVPVILIGYLFQCWARFHNFGMLVTERTELYTAATWIAAVVALVGYLTLVPTLLAMGAALTAVASFGVRFAISYYFSQKLFPVQYDWIPVARQCGVAAVVCSISYLAPAMPIGWSVLFHGGLAGVYAAGVWILGGIPPADRARIMYVIRSPRAALGGMMRA